MKKEEFIKRYGKEQYDEYLEKQRLLAKKWREKNRAKSRDYALKYYYDHKAQEINKKR